MCTLYALTPQKIEVTWHTACTAFAIGSGIMSRFPVIALCSADAHADFSFMLHMSTDGNKRQVDYFQSATSMKVLCKLLLALNPTKINLMAWKGAHAGELLVVSQAGRQQTSMLWPV